MVSTPFGSTLPFKVAEVLLTPFASVVVASGAEVFVGPEVVKFMMVPFEVPNWFWAFSRKKYLVRGSRSDTEIATDTAVLPDATV